ncbi:MAG: CDGSH iron-sulfur domain-containing protein [Alistipes sp.]|nr:CDGSH iron-sulfur domain-containing protein [Alistipes sp.]
MSIRKIEEGSTPAGGDIRINILPKGPYEVYGRPPLAVQCIMPDTGGESRHFQQGRRFSTQENPVHLCRCGASERKPYCDGSHTRTEWNPELDSREEGLLDNVEITEGGSVTLTDNERYCVFARFCHPAGGAWELTAQSDDPQARQLAIREASMCPTGRLMAWDRRSGKPFEYEFEPSLGLIEDIQLGVSGGLWVRGGIPVSTTDGRTFEIRNRVVLCRCGRSSNKPYCDGTHVSAKWRDNLDGEPAEATVPEKVY